MKTRLGKAPITERALIQRLNRKLKADDLIVKKPRGWQASPARLGDYYVLDLTRNFIAEKNLSLGDLEDMARKHKVLQAWETVEP